MDKNIQDWLMDIRWCATTADTAIKHSHGIIDSDYELEYLEAIVDKLVRILARKDE